jgi:hypothetical protein
MKFLVPNYSCLQNPWLGGYRPQIPVLAVLCPHLNLLNPPPPRTIFLGTPLQTHITLPSFLPYSKHKQISCLRRRRYFYYLLIIIYREDYCHWSVLVPISTNNPVLYNLFSVIPNFCSAWSLHHVWLYNFGYYSKCCFLFCFFGNLFLPTNGMCSSFLTYSVIC